jgi:uncharacterized protein
MRFFNYTQIFCLILLSFFLFASCKKEKVDPDKPEFKRMEMLENIGNNIIIPHYLDLQKKADALRSSTGKFTADPNTANLTAARAAFLDAYRQWQKCSAFEFGPAEEVLLRANVNTFPTDTARVKQNIANGNLNLQAASSLTAKGFPAIDYLLFSGDVLERFSSSTDAANAKKYLNELVKEIYTLVNGTYTKWLPTGGNYTKIFTNSLGNDVGSSIGMLVNQLNYDYEIIKTNKLAIPLGKKSLGNPLPDKFEALYCGKSKEMIMDQLLAIENLYLGIGANGEDNQGLSEYLLYLDAKHNNQTLDAAIKNQFKAIKASMDKVKDPLVDELKNPTNINAAYIDVQKMVVLLKTDMPSALGVLITYQDNDGD